LFCELLAEHGLFFSRIFRVLIERGHEHTVCGNEALELHSHMLYAQHSRESANEQSQSESECPRGEEGDGCSRKATANVPAKKKAMDAFAIIYLYYKENK